MLFRTIALSGLLALAAGCESAPTTSTQPPPTAVAPAAVISYPEMAGQVVPPPAGFEPVVFESFVANRPTLDEFRARYPTMLVVTSDMPVTQEYRTDYTRFFPTIDAEGRVVGGAFY